MFVTHGNRVGAAAARSRSLPPAAGSGPARSDNPGKDGHGFAFHGGITSPVAHTGSPDALEAQLEAVTYGGDAA